MCGETQSQQSRLYQWTFIHGIILTIIWLGVADFMIVIVRYWKNWSKYLLVHSMFGLFNIIGIFAIVIVMIFGRGQFFSQCFFKMNSVSLAHSIIGMFFLLMVVLIQAVGLLGKFGIQNKQKSPQKTALYKKIHVYLGYFLYLLSKAEVFLGWWIKGGHKWSTALTVIMTYNGLFLLGRFFILQRWYKQQNQIFYVPTNQYLYNSVKYEGLLEMISKGCSKKQIMQQYPSIRYVMYKYKVCDLTNFLHPGGAFIIEKMLGEQVSRYIYGAYGLQSSKIASYSHTMYAQKRLQQCCVGQIDTSVLGLMKCKIGDKINVPTTWTLQTSQILSPNTKLYHFKSQRYDLSTQPNILYLGRHFLLCPAYNSGLASRLYTLTLCLSPPLRKFTSDMIQKLENSDGPLAILSQKSTPCLPFVMKMYEVGGFSQYLFKAVTGTEIKIQGPFGRGLQITQGKLYAFCGGTGVLPLLDLIYQILILIYAEKVQNKKLNRLPQNFKLILYLAINKAQMLDGLQIITRTYLLNKKYNMDIFDLHLRISSGPKIKDIPQFLQKFNDQTIRSIIKDSAQLSKVVICGSPSMNYEVYQSLSKILKEQKIHIL